MTSLSDKEQSGLDSYHFPNILEDLSAPGKKTGSCPSRSVEENANPGIQDPQLEMAQKITPSINIPAGDVASRRYPCLIREGAKAPVALSCHRGFCLSLRFHSYTVLFMPDL
jgi:hypothetical protein